MKVSAENLKKEILNSKKPVLVEFWSSWCLPCQMMKLSLEEFEREYQDKIKILKINPDLNPLVSSWYNIKGLPTFILFEKGKEIRREVGAQSKQKLVKIIEDFLKK